ncbi:MAG: hypothetical protein ACE5DM_03785 [Candidatus Nanoarchaeia archaeon]
MAKTLDSRIIDLLSRDIRKLYSISDIAKELGVAYSHAYLFVKRLIEQGVIATQRIGKTFVCRLNLKQPLTLARLAEVSYQRTSEWCKKDPRSEKLLSRVQMVKEGLHCVLLQNNKIILIVPDKSGDFSIFKNRFRVRLWMR